MPRQAAPQNPPQERDFPRPKAHVNLINQITFIGYPITQYSTLGRYTDICNAKGIPPQGTVPIVIQPVICMLKPEAVAFIVEYAVRTPEIIKWLVLNGNGACTIWVKDEETRNFVITQLSNTLLFDQYGFWFARTPEEKIVLQNYVGSMANAQVPDSPLYSKNITIFERELPPHIPANQAPTFFIRQRHAEDAPPALNNATTARRL